MKRYVAYILVAVAVAAVAAYMAVTLSRVGRQRHERHCTGLNVTVTDSSRHSFITARDVAGYISKEYGDCMGQSVGDIDLDRIEKIIRAKNPVMACEAYISSDGRLNVRVVQRTPVLRFRGAGEDFFTDSDGYIFHLQSGGASSVTTVSGSIPVRVGEDFRGELEDSTAEAWIRNMIALSKYMRRVSYWNDASLSVRDNSDVVLTPDTGRPQFILGRPDNFQSKFSRIGKYYSAIVPSAGEDFYSTVNLKYAGQIVCRK